MALSNLRVRNPPPRPVHVIFGNHETILILLLLVNASIYSAQPTNSFFLMYSNQIILYPTWMYPGHVQKAVFLLCTSTLYRKRSLPCSLQSRLVQGSPNTQEPAFHLLPPGVVNRLISMYTEKQHTGIFIQINTATRQC